MESDVGTAISKDVDRFFGKLGISGAASAILMVVFGVLVIVFPELIAWLIGGYLIIAGAINLAGHLSTMPKPG